MPRPKKADPRAINLTIRVSTAELETLQQRARFARTSIAAYTRAAAFGAAIEAATAAQETSPRDAALRELAHQIHKVGVNLNQMTRRMHEDHSPAPPELPRLLDEIRAYVRKARQDPS